MSHAFESDPLVTSGPLEASETYFERGFPPESSTVTLFAPMISTRATVSRMIAARHWKFSSVGAG